MSRDALLRLLGERLGLDPASLGERVVDHALQQVRRQFDDADDAILWRRARADPAEFARLAEPFLIGETWFFRAPEQFRDLLRFAREGARGRRPLRVLSLPCASGEEAWSAAITLLEGGFAPAEINVLGIDVSAGAIATAQRGRYRAGTGHRRAPGEPWLEADGNDWQITPTLARCVRFRVGNALDPGLFLPGERFDVVFCRHLLIYLHPAARRQLLAQLCKVLAPPALLLAGQAELLTTLADGFVPYRGGSPLSFLWGEPKAARKLPARAEPAAPLALPAAAPRAPSPMPQMAVVRDPDIAAARPPDAAHTSRLPPAVGLPQAVRELADGGQLDAARAACLQHLQRQPDAVDALFLLATLESARGDLAAADAALGRVLYLQPEHLDALEHRAALARRRGDDVQAGRLMARVQRLRERRGVVV